MEKDENYKLRGKIPDHFFNYKRTSDILPQDGFFLDTHAHSTASDGWMTPEQCIKWEIANGFHAFVLTDHNTGKNNKPIMELQNKYPEIVIIPGFEWTTIRIHLNFLGIEDFPRRVPMNPNDEKIKEAINKAKEMGAVVQVDHIPWTVNEPWHRLGKCTHPSRDNLLEWGVDGFEINNEMRWYDPKTVIWLENLKEENQLPRPIFMSTGTDIHNPINEWVSGWTELLLTPEERKNPDWTVIKKALLEGRTRIWVDHDYYMPYEAKQLKLEREKNQQKESSLILQSSSDKNKESGTIRINEFEVGMTREFSHTFTQEETETLADLIGDHNPFHYEGDFIRKTRFKKPIVHGLLVGGMISHFGGEIFGPGCLAETIDFKFLKPVFFGETIRAIAEITGVSKTTKRLSFMMECFNKKGEKVTEGKATCIPYRV